MIVIHSVINYFLVIISLRNISATKIEAVSYILHIENQVSKEILNNPMKTKELRSPKSIKINKRISETEPEITRTKVCLPRNDEEYLSPMHIKLPKNKLLNKKEQKTSKDNGEF